MTREEAIYRLKNTAWLGTDNDREATEQAVEMAIESLQDRPTGTWEEKYIEEAPPFLKHRFYCSNCGEWITYGTADFCCNCGADMRGGDYETTGDN